jgi:hypothetical protein
VYAVSRLPTGVASLDLPRVMLVTCGSGKALGQRVAQALICKQDVAGFESRRLHRRNACWAGNRVCLPNAWHQRDFGEEGRKGGWARG